MWQVLKSHAVEDEIKSFGATLLRVPLKFWIVSFLVGLVVVGWGPLQGPEPNADDATALFIELTLHVLKWEWVYLKYVAVNTIIPYMVLVCTTCRLLLWLCICVVVKANLTSTLELALWTKEQFGLHRGSHKLEELCSSLRLLSPLSLLWH